MRVAFSFLAFTLLTMISWAQNALPNPRPPYAPRPTDKYWEEQWNFDHRGEDGGRFGADINVRGAWQRTRGEGVIIGIATDAVDLNHRDLATNQAAQFHYDFERNVTNGAPLFAGDNFGTPVAGLAVAAQNGEGIVGVAPAAKFAVWKIFPDGYSQIPGRTFIAPEKMAQLFTYHNNEVAVQFFPEVETAIRYGPVAQTDVEWQAISNAVTLGRNGKGVVMVRPSGFTFYPDFRDVNDDAYMSDPRAIAVGAVRADGRVTSYSSRGAAILCAAVSGDIGDGFPNLFTTDRTGNSAGFNIITFPSDPPLSDYVWGNLRFSGTPDAAAQIAGLCALILSANPNLTYRDVQQILIHSSRHLDKGDPQLRRNGAGYLVSHKSGYGIPDAAEAVRLADHWQNRPGLVRRTIQSDITSAVNIPDAGLRAYFTDQTSQPALNRSFAAFPSIGLHPDDPTAELPLIDVGTAPAALTVDLHGKAALIEDPNPTFPLLRQLDRVAAVGAEFAIVFNTTNSPTLLYDWLVKRLDFAPIPVVLVPTEAAPIIKDYITNHTNLRIQLRATPALAHFVVEDAMLVEHVGVRVRTSHPSRQDLRITLVSPQGTRSIMQTINSDQNPGPVDWTYWSVQHFYERSSGIWTLEVTDEVQDITGQLLGAELYLEGTPVVDLDDDGLDDVWEIANFGSLDQGALDDPDDDGSWNAREQILATNPQLDQTTFKLVTSLVQSNAVRVAFPSVEGTNYILRASTNLNSSLQDMATIPGAFGETEIITDLVEPYRFFEVRKAP